MKIVKEVIIVVFCLLLIPAAAFLTTAAKQRFKDGPSLVFSGGPLEAGALHAGAEPDWSVVSAVSTIELQLLDPPRSRRIWTAEYEGKLYVWSGYMSTAIGRLVFSGGPLEAGALHAGAEPDWRETSLVRYRTMANCSYWIRPVSRPVGRADRIAKRGSRCALTNHPTVSYLVRDPVSRCRPSALAGRR